MSPSLNLGPILSKNVFDHEKASLMNEHEVVAELEKDENIRYFKLPENNGWNSGRALLISQVQTEYFVSCDDDWIFNDSTNLEKMLEIIEKTGFDVIGGGLGENLHLGPNDSYFNNWLNHGKYRIQKGANGDCVKRDFGFYGQGFQNIFENSDF